VPGGLRGILPALFGPTEGYSCLLWVTIEDAFGSQAALTRLKLREDSKPLTSRGKRSTSWRMSAERKYDPPTTF
jgi:hypothetical protein